MKNICICICLFSVFFKNCNQPKSADTPAYSKGDLSKIKWIEGNWMGMDGETPFYELYKITSDSTIAITTYEWTGMDSTKSSASMLLWKDGRYYLGEDLRWKVTGITDSSISMVSSRDPGNTILWKKSGEGWDAILKSGQVEKVYNLKAVDHFR